MKAFPPLQGAIYMTIRLPFAFLTWIILERRSNRLIVSFCFDLQSGGNFFRVSRWVRQDLKELLASLKHPVNLVDKAEKHGP